jgi:hypothetical protein
VFPNGRTVHLPADGNPMPGYELAAADIERGNHRRAEQPQGRSLFASLFGGTQDAEESADNNAVRQNPPPARRQAPAATPAATPAPVEVAVSQPVPLPPTRPVFQVASAASTPAPAPAPRPVNLASLSPNEIIVARGYWQGLPETSTEISSLRRAGRTQTASADPESTAGLGRFARNDRVPPDVALAYAAQVEAASAHALALPSAPRSAPAVVSTLGNASVALRPEKPAPTATVRTAKVGDRVNDPWLRGVVMAPSLQRSLTTTTFGVPDFRTLQPFMQKPGSTVMMTFSSDPHLGLTTDHFTGSAVVFQATVTFGMRTAALQQ